MAQQDESIQNLPAADLYALLHSSGLLESFQTPEDAEASLPAHDGVQRVKILQTAVRPVDPDHFRLVGQALVQRKRLRILYHGRRRDELTERDVSPQRLVHYRSGWYLDTWCHLRDGLRHFALDRMHPVVMLDEAAHEVDSAELENHFASAYGIFSGEPSAVAVLRFSPSAARWIADEQWHPQQRGRVLGDGSYELQIPYANPRELIMDILKHGPDVEVLAPDELRHRIAMLAARTASLYRPKRN